MPPSFVVNEGYDWFGNLSGCCGFGNWVFGSGALRAGKPSGEPLSPCGRSERLSRSAGIIAPYGGRCDRIWGAAAWSQAALRMIRRAANDRPGRKRPVPVIASQCAHWRGNPHLPSPFSMFSDGNLKTPTFSIFNFQFSILPGRAAERGRLRAVPTGARGGVHVANNVRRYGRAAACGARGRQIAGATGGRGERGRLRKADRQNFCLCPILCPILRPIMRPIMRSIMRSII